MPICELCDGESFYDKDGLFYCNGCNTQSQDIQVELKQEVDVENYSMDTRLKTTVGKKRQRRHFDIGKPWVAYEGFQYMIKSQVESLIAMGFNEKLKDCVGKLWFYYLKMKKVAFCPEEPETITLAAHSKRRKNEGVLPLHIKKQRGLVKKEDDAGFEQEDTSKGDSFELNKEIDDLDKLRFPSDEEMNVDEKIDHVVDSSDEEKCGSIGSLKLTEKKSSIFEMKQHFTICFCYLGLSLLKEPVLLSDLIRWTHEGMLPYHKASRVLPPEMKFASADYQKFCNRRKLSMWTLAGDFHNMCYRLNIKSTQGKEYLKLLVASVVVDLEFASSVQTLAWYLIDVDFQLKEKRYKDYIMDGPVSAYLIVALKFIYYLDDNHEMKNEVRNSLLDLLKLPPVENWKKWVTRSMLKRKKKLYNGIPRDEEDLKFIRDLSVYEDYCIKDSFNDFNIRNATSSYRRNEGKWKSGSKDPKEQYFKQFYSIAQVLNPSLDFEKIKRVPTSFPLSVDYLGGLVQYDMHDDVIYGTASCIAENLNNVGVNYGDKKDNSGVCITGSINNGDTKYIGSCITENVGNVDLDNGGKSNACDLLSGVNTTSNVSNKKYDIGGSNDGECSDRYLYYADDQGEDTWNDSYRYLIGVISRRMEMRPHDVQFHVRRLERRYFIFQMRGDANTASKYVQGPYI